MRRSIRSASLVALAVMLACWGAGCSDGDDGASSTTTDRTSSGAGAARFCDVYLDYLADASDEQLAAVVDAAEDPLVNEYATAIDEASDLTEVLAATLDLDDLARRRCQTEWTAGAQGAGDTPAAAQALLDALIAGDPVGARNVASANAIAVFEPWEPRPVGADGTPTIGGLDAGGFTLVLDEATIASCQVETGVVIACQIAT